MGFLWPVVQGLSEPQSHLFILLQMVVRKHQAGAVPALVDEDVANAAASLASTYETADRGIIYEHQATSLQAQNLANELKSTLSTIMKDARPSAQRHAAVVLRLLEKAARTAHEELEEGPRSYLELLERLPSDDSDAQSSSSEAGHVGPDKPEADPPRLIVP